MPTLLPRLALEIVVAQVSLKALVKADRSTFAFLRLVTIPLLLASDLALSYSMTNFQIAGSIVIFLTLFLLAKTHALRLKGSGLVILSAALAAVTITLFKYDITNFNSVAAEQIIVYSTLLVFFWFMGWRNNRENTFDYLKKLLPEVQSISNGAGGALNSFAFGLAPASVVSAMVRGLSLLWAIIFGNIYFHERHLVFKLMAYVMVISGILLISMSF